jgi:hypothetical protein
MWVPALLDHGWYVRHKRDLAAATRLIVWAVPVVWKPVGLQDVMRVQPSPGALGWVADALRLGIGERSLARALGLLWATTRQMLACGGGTSGGAGRAGVRAPHGVCFAAR